MEDLIICVTGKLQKYTRNQILNVIKKLGGTPSTTITKKVTTLVVGDISNSTKLEKARKYGTNIIRESEFMDFLTLYIALDECEKLLEESK